MGERIVNADRMSARAHSGAFFCFLLFSFPLVGTSWFVMTNRAFLSHVLCCDRPVLKRFVVVVVVVSISLSLSLCLARFAYSASALGITLAPPSPVPPRRRRRCYCPYPPT